jgi:hypothetical protein
MVVGIGVFCTRYSHRKIDSSGGNRMGRDVVGWCGKEWVWSIEDGRWRKGCRTRSSDLVISILMGGEEREGEEEDIT